MIQICINSNLKFTDAELTDEGTDPEENPLEDLEMNVERASPQTVPDCDIQLLSEIQEGLEINDERDSPQTVPDCNNQLLSEVQQALAQGDEQKISQLHSKILRLREEMKLMEEEIENVELKNLHFLTNDDLFLELEKWKLELEKIITNYRIVSVNFHTHQKR